MTDEKYLEELILKKVKLNHGVETNIKLYKIEKLIVELRFIEIAPFADAETHFRRGKKLLIDNSLSEEKIKGILAKLSEGRKLSNEERQHILTAQEFYRAHETMFLRRAQETAFTAREVEFIAKKLAAAKGQPVLDVGCGLGRLTIPLLKMGYNMYGIDVAPNLIARAKKEAPEYQERFMIANLFHLPFRTNYFSAVTTN